MILAGDFCRSDISEREVCLCLARKMVVTYVCVYVELFPRLVCKVFR